MTRRTAASLLVGLALATGVLVPGASSSAEVRVAAKPIRPAVGQCHRLTPQKIDAKADPSDPVPCTTRHTTRVIRVVDLPKRLDFDDDLQAFVTKACYPPLVEAVGGAAALSKTAFDFVFFYPTRAEQSRGARYVRCDVGLRGGARFVALPTAPPPFVRGTIPDDLRRCNGGTRVYFTCDRPHKFRATDAYRVPGRTYPGTDGMRAIATKQCRRLVGPRYFYYFTSDLAWDADYRQITCLTPTTK